MKQWGIVFEERDKDDEKFCGVYMVAKQAKIIFVNANLRTSRKHFTIAYVLATHYKMALLSVIVVAFLGK